MRAIGYSRRHYSRSSNFQFRTRLNSLGVDYLLPKYIIIMSLKLHHKKFSKMKVIKFLSFFLVTQAQKVIWGKKCAEVPVLTDFELAKYAGVWYEQVRYPNTFQKEGSM